MHTVKNRAELDANIRAFAKGLASGDADEKRYFEGLLLRGTCFVVVASSGGKMFAPSRFIGYANNSRTRHESNVERDGRVTNPVIEEVMGQEWGENEQLESEYREFCVSLGLQPRRSGSFGVRRTFIDATGSTQVLAGRAVRNEHIRSGGVGAGKTRYDWIRELHEWLKTNRDVSPETAADIVSFFQMAFTHVRCPEDAWFGIHSSGASLVVGGIFLAAIQRSGTDRGLWLLVDKEHPKLDGIENRPVKSTLRSGHPLVWAHSKSWADVSKLIRHSRIWDSFSSASLKIKHSPISHGREDVQKRRQKYRVSDLWRGTTVNSVEEQFQSEVAQSLDDSPSLRRKRLEKAPSIPSTIEVKTVSFLRNPDVVAEVLYRAQGICEECRKPAPFRRRSDNSPFLEVHHKKPLADGGEDTVSNAVALCPNCHRRAHYG